MNIEDWKKNWDELGKDDPLWVVLTNPSKKGERWDPVDFFATGREEIKDMLASVANAGVKLKAGRALDFGCGVGRLSQALAEHFDSVVGIDISPSMIEHANRFNRFPEKCSFVLNALPDLSVIKSASCVFVYSNIALQHIEPRFSTKYVAEFMRVLAPGGVAVFQMLSATPARSLFPQTFVDWYRRRKHQGKSFFPMYGVPETLVRRIVREGNCEIFNHHPTPFTWRWVSHRYFVRKP